MTGTLAGALAARQIPVYGGNLLTEVEGEIEEGDKQACPVSQSVERGIKVEWTADITEV
jgi:uncharacterized OsmC-like protein